MGNVYHSTFALVLKLFSPNQYFLTAGSAILKAITVGQYISNVSFAKKQRKNNPAIIAKFFNDGFFVNKTKYTNHGKIPKERISPPW